MKILPHLFALVLCTTYNVYGQNSSVSIPELLKKIEVKNQDIKSLSYRSVYRQIYSGSADSVTTVTASIWLEKKPADTIFNEVFHVRGIDNAGHYDCYYDGQNAYEVRREKKLVTIINPYSFPNDANNPAKARTALLPVLSFLTSTRLVKDLLDEKPEQKLTESTSNWLIELKYPKNSYGMFITRWLTVSKKSLAINEYKQQVLWNGTHNNSYYTITNISVNRKEIAAQIPLKSSLNAYTIEHWENQPAKVLQSELISKPAPSFQYPSFSGRIINLDKLKGKYILLDFWESWCGNCILALPELKELDQKYRNKGLQVIGVSTDNRDQIIKLIKANELNYINLAADKNILADYKINPRPTYVLINPEGVIIQYTSNFNDIKSVIENISSLK